MLPLREPSSLKQSVPDDPAQPRWWIIHTRPRCEKKMDEWLERQGMNHYLPTRPKLRIYPGKKVLFAHPLFPGYAFGEFSLLLRNAVWGSFAAAILEVVDQKRFLQELQQIQMALAAGPLQECLYLPVGQRGRIATGKLRGLEGVVLRRGNKQTLILSVEMLQRSVSVEVGSDMLELVG
jgi:transcription antitermination factor NusG